MTNATGKTTEESARLWLIEYLRDRDVPCPLCGYNLRQLDSPRCPECGRDIRLSVNLAEPYLRGWITAVAALCASAGVGIVMLIVVCQEGLPPANRHPLLCTAIYAFMASIPLAVTLVRARRAFLRLEQRLQALIASVAVVLLICELAAFFMGLER
jgi:hypothetical protein